METRVVIESITLPDQDRVATFVLLETAFPVRRCRMPSENSLNNTVHILYSMITGDSPAKNNRKVYTNYRN